MITYLKAHWGAALCVATSLAAGYALGHRPVEVRKEQKTETAATVKVDEVKTEKEHKVTVTDRKPDGTVHTVVTVDKGATTATETAATESAKSSFTYTTKSYSTYRLRLDAGWDPRRLDLSPHELTIGIERRMLGPVWLGVWGRQEFGARPVTALGLSLAFEF